jgi:hypothetical protein
MYDAYFQKAFATVAWYPKFELGEFVFYRRGTGETCWQHKHGDDPNKESPARYNYAEAKAERAYICECGARLSRAVADKARDENGYGYRSKA